MPIFRGVGVFGGAEYRRIIEHHPDISSHSPIPRNIGELLLITPREYYPRHSPIFRYVGGIVLRWISERSPRPAYLLYLPGDGMTASRSEASGELIHNSIHSIQKKYILIFFIKFYEKIPPRYFVSAHLIEGVRCSEPTPSIRCRMGRVFAYIPTH